MLDDEGWGHTCNYNNNVICPLQISVVTIIFSREFGTSKSHYSTFLTANFSKLKGHNYELKPPLYECGIPL